MTGPFVRPEPGLSIRCKSAQFIEPRALGNLTTLMKIKLIAIFTILLSASLITALLIAGSFLTAPTQQPVGQLPPDLRGVTVQFQSSSGSTIHGWLIPGEKGKGALILMHGVRSNRTSMLDRARFLSRVGFSVLLFDFQAHGESPGKHITFGYLESRDAQSAVNFMRSTMPDEKVGVIGVSMGGAATLLASPPLQLDAVVLEMVYPTIDEAVGDRLAMRLGSWSRILTPLLTSQLKLRFSVDAQTLRPIDHVGTIKTPKLFIVGERDQHTLLAESQRIFDTAANPKDLWVIKGASHTDLHQVATAEYESRVTHFFQSCFGSK